MEANKIGIKVGGTVVFISTEGNCIYNESNIKDRCIDYKTYGIQLCMYIKKDFTWK
jgi:hypothetical protein